ncbi:SRPBCC domain-containing protein [Leifsonia sp. F6_8S_P_1B]|uniref:SRPBCC domain-containing protein n=1 Tax=Leifsonia williamsii TaxID=3035919 RepID=A0ABT8KBQ2_9MICO|nr:SRPBCC domain-containing protein [Leifsonia williamsii]MDN4614868.1 SRPBCC domain-containing protein [Leifsonia williamsii]
MTGELHETFTVTSRLEAPPERVFAAFADDAVRRRWFRLPGRSPEYRHLFAVGGGEEAHSTFTHPDGSTESLRYRSRYLDIVPARRIVFGYESSVDDVLRWTSLVTVLLAPDGDGTTLDWIEQVAFLERTGDGSADLPHLRGGTILRLNGLPAALDGAA